MCCLPAPRRLASHVQDKPQKWQQRGGRRAAAALVRASLLRLRRLFQRHVQRADGVPASSIILAAPPGRGRARRVLLRLLCGRGGGPRLASGAGRVDSFGQARVHARRVTRCRYTLGDSSGSNNCNTLPLPGASESRTSGWGRAATLDGLPHFYFIYGREHKVADHRGHGAL